MDDRRVFPSLKKFHYKNYFESKYDSQAEEKTPYIKLTGQGIDMVAAYYFEKYYLEQLTRTANVEDFINQFKLNEQTYRSGNDKRVPFIIGSLVNVRQLSIESWHSSPAMYIKEGDKEAILFFDSLGSTKEADEIANKTGLKVYTISRPRQMDYYSCHTDALIFLRELGAKDEKGHYRMSNIFSTLEEKAINPDKNPTEIKFTDNLLMMVQNPRLINEQKQGGTIVHQSRDHGSEDLDALLQRYIETSQFKYQRASSYLRQKGLKFANLIEIQFYLKQLEMNLGKDSFTKVQQENFIREAKKILKEQGNVTPENLEARAGLYEFANKFQAKLLGVTWHDDYLKEQIKPVEKASTSIFTETASSIKQTKTDPIDYGAFYHSVLERQAEENEDVQSEINQKKTPKTKTQSGQTNLFHQYTPNLTAIQKSSTEFFSLFDQLVKKIKDAQLSVQKKKNKQVISSITEALVSIESLRSIAKHDFQQLANRKNADPQAIYNLEYNYINKINTILINTKLTDIHADFLQLVSHSTARKNKR